MNAAQERKLLNAAEQVAQHVSAGSLPTDAVIKVAQDMRLRQGEIKLVAHAYNTGATRQHFDSTSDPLEKAAAFPLADPDAAVAAMFPEQVKTAAAIQQETAVAFDYAVSPMGMLARRKKAAVILPELPKIAPRETYLHPDSLQKQAVAERQRHKQAVDEARRQTAVALDKMAQAFCDLVEYFETPGHPSLASVKEAVANVYGGEGAAILGTIETYRPHLRKAAAAPYDYSVISQPLPLIGQMLQAIEKHHACGMEYYKQAAYAQASVINNSHDLSDSVLPNEKQAIANPLALMLTGSYAKDMIDKTVQGMPEARMQEATSQLADPQHEAALRNIRVRSMLNDLMTEDPVVSRHNPQDVLQAYNDLNGLAPHAADQKLIMQAALRKQLEQGNVEPFEVDQLLGIDSKLRQQGGANSESVGVL